MRARIAVLASGRGSNLQAILDYLDRVSERASYEVAVVLSNREAAPALLLGRDRGIPSLAFDAGADGRELLDHLTSQQIEIVALAGYLKKIPSAVVSAYEGRIVNVHPALLPLHGGAGMYGARVHEAVIAGGERESGATVHLVDAEYDRGPVVAQARVRVMENDDARSLAERVLAVEHILYPRALDIIAALHIASAKE